MNRNRLIVGLTTAMLVALLASLYVYRTFQRATHVTPQEMATIVVADHPLQVGTRLDASDLRTIEDCMGRAVITPMAQNEAILEAKLAPSAAGAGLPATIPEGMRAVSVAVNDVVGVAGFVVPGTMVDVLVTGVLPGRHSSGDNNITRTILENVRVLAAGQKIEQDRSGKPQKVPVITLLVSPENADKLTMASTQGKIQLALRNTVDTKIANPPPVLQAALFAGPAEKPVHVTGRHAAHSSPPPPYMVEVITGTKRETKRFANE
jgi:pilus assembly protein CpaB